MIHSWSQVPGDERLKEGEGQGWQLASRKSWGVGGRVGERPGGKEGRKIEEEVEDVRGEGSVTLD